MNKFLSIVCAAVVATLIVGCGGDSNVRDDQPDPAAANGSGQAAAAEQADALISDGLQKLLKGNTQAAVANFNDALALQPYNPTAHYYKGLAYLYFDADFGAALDPLIEALMNVEDTGLKARVLAALGDLQLTRGSSEKSIARGIRYLNDSIDLSPTVEALLHLQRHYTLTGNGDGLTWVLGVAQQHHSDSVFTRIATAVNAARNGQAESALETADELRDRSSYAVLLAEIYALSGQPEAAVSLLESYMKNVVPTDARRAITRDWLKANPNLESLQGNEQFNALTN
jgi:tetratricopeptide (TPR) repeat protein